MEVSVPSDPTFSRFTVVKPRYTAMFLKWQLMMVYSSALGLWRDVQKKIATRKLGQAKNWQYIEGYRFGVISRGDISRGVISRGGISRGGISKGGISRGVISRGVISKGGISRGDISSLAIYERSIGFGVIWRDGISRLDSFLEESYLQ